MSGAASGVPGLDATHAWCDLPSTVLVTLNHPTNWPRFKLLELPGFFDSPDSDDNRDSKTGTFGEDIYPSYARGKDVGYMGVILGQSRDECLVGKTSLAAAFGPDITTGLNPERRMVITPDSGLVGSAPSSITHTFVGRLLSRGLKIDDQMPKAYERGEPAARWGLRFTLAIRITDGRFYEWSGSAESNPKWA